MSLSSIESLVLAVVVMPEMLYYAHSNRCFLEFISLATTFSPIPEGASGKCAWRQLVSGRKPRITTDDVLEIFDENVDSCEPFAAPEIAERLNCHRNTARNKLEDLVFIGDLETKKVSSSGRVYWRPCETK